MSESGDGELSTAAQEAVAAYQDNFVEPTENHVEAETSAENPEVLNELANSLGLPMEETTEAESNAEDEAPSEEASEEESEDSGEEEEANSDTPDTEVLEIDGKNLTIKYTDRDWVKKTAKAAVNYQKGMRQFQKERDAANKELEALKPDVAKYKEGFEKLDALHIEAKESGDWASFISQVTGEDFGQIVEDYIAKSEYLSAMTDEERDSYNVRQNEKKRLRELEAEIAKRDQEVESKQKEAAKTEKSALQKQVQADVTSAFHEYKFTNELKDAKEVHDMNKIMFQQFNNEIGKYEAKDISVELIHKVMKEQSDKLRKYFNTGKQAKAKAKSVKKKANTAKDIARAVEENKPRVDLQSHLDSGDILGAVNSALFGKQ